MIAACCNAHAESALRGNASHQALVLAAAGSGDYFKAIAAALMTLGERHGPLSQTYALLTTEPDVKAILRAGLKVPGWGNSFVNGPDPIWTETAETVKEANHALFEKIERITEVLHEEGKDIYPNPSCLTAAVAITVGLPKEICGYLFLLGRLEVWTGEFERVYGGR